MAVIGNACVEPKKNPHTLSTVRAPPIRGNGFIFENVVDSAPKEKRPLTVRGASVLVVVVPVPLLATAIAVFKFLPNE